MIFAVCASAAHAVDVPSGQPVELQEVLVDSVGDATWLRFRFIAPRIARAQGTFDLETVEGDMSHLCTSVALPYMADFDLSGDVIVISFADRETEFATPDPDATQLFEAYRPVNDVCMWEGL